MALPDHRPELRSRVARRALGALLAGVGFLSTNPALQLAATSPPDVVLVDAIAPGAVTGELGLGTDPAVVGRGGFATFTVAASPSLAGTPVQIWTRGGAGAWRRTGAARVGPDGWAMYGIQVEQWTAIQARVPATAAHRAAVSQGRIVAVDPAGRTVVRLPCSETGSWPTGTIAARAVGVAVGSAIELSLCAAAGRAWTVGDVDHAAVGIAPHVASTPSQTQGFDLKVLRSGSRTVRLVERLAGAHQGTERSLLLVLEMAALPVGVVRNLPLTPAVPCGPSGPCQVMADVYAPIGPGPWPVVVLLRGGPGGLGARAVYSAFAARLASQGLVVYNADYRDGPGSGGGFPRAFDDAACAVRVARQTAARYGGNPTSVSLVGHSLGAYVGSIVALSADSFDSSCLASGPGAPNVFVGIAGPYVLDEPNLQADFTSVLGGTRAQVPYAWRIADPLAWVGRRPGARVRLVQGTADPTVDPAAAIALETALERAGFDTALTTVEGATHVSLIRDTKDGQWAMAVILAAIE